MLSLKLRNTPQRRMYCDRSDDTSDMNAAIQGPGTDFGASYATVFRIHGTEKYKSIATQCLQAERILPWQRILLTVKSPKQPNCCGGRYNRERMCSISGPGDLLKGVHLDSQESVTNSQSVSQLATSIRNREEIQGPLRGKTPEGQNSL
jgi:hypothetical protein